MSLTFVEKFYDINKTEMMILKFFWRKVKRIDYNKIYKSNLSQR